MGYDVRWGNEEKTIVLGELLGDWTWDDFYQLSKAQMVLLDTVDHRVHLIVFDQNEHVSMPMGALSNLKRLINITHPNEDKVVIVNIPAVAKALLDILRRVYGIRALVEQYMFASSLEEAYAALDEYEKNREKS